jgi:type II secretory pathway pseudopilin PulG
MRDRAIVGIACLAAAIIAPWLLVIQPKRAQASKLQGQINAEQSQLSSVRQQLAAGNAARAAFASSYTTLIRLGEAVPTDDNTPSLIYQLQAAAKAAKVDFQSLTFNAGQGASTSTSNVNLAAPKSKSSSSSSSTSSTTSSTTSPLTPALPPGATIGPAGFPIEPFTFTFNGNFFHLANFLGRLQRFVVASNQKLSVSGRLMTLDAISLADSGTFPQITATISATTYLLPSSQGLLNGATPAGPASSTTQTVSNTSPSSSLPPAVVTSPVR